MRTGEAELLIVPGWLNSPADHWQSRWAAKLSSARRIEQEDWQRPVCADWVATIVEAVAAAARPVVLVAHSAGVTACVHAAPHLPAGKVAGAFLVAAPDLEAPGLKLQGIWPAVDGGFTPLPMAPLPFPAMLVASSADPYCTLERARAFADAWGATLVEAGDSGHLNPDSGHGPWPEGLMRFGLFLQGLG